MADRDLTRPDHLPKLRADGQPRHPSWLPRQRRGTTPQMIGRYPDYDVLANRENWDEATRRVVEARLQHAGPLRFFSAQEEPTLRAFCDVATAQDTEPRVPVAEMVDDKLAAGRLDGFRYADMPRDPDTWRLVLRGLDETARRATAADASPRVTPRRARRSSRRSPRAQLSGGAWDELERQPGVVGVHAGDPGRVLLTPVGVERDRLRGPGLPAGLHAPRSGRARSSRTSARAPPPRTRCGVASELQP